MDNNIDPKVQKLVEGFSNAIIKPVQETKAAPSQILEAMLRQASLFAGYNELPDMGSNLWSVADSVAQARVLALPVCDADSIHECPEAQNPVKVAGNRWGCPKCERPVE